jgi:hypothetical protein
MPVNAMNVGADYSFQYYDGLTGVLIALGDVQNVRIIAQKHDIATRPYNAFPRYGYVPDGYKIDFTITRNVSTLEDLMVNYAAQFNSGTVISPGYLNESINNSDNTISRYQYQNCVVFLTDHGDISREKTVTLKFEGMASNKIQIA